jgi:putative acetyltransferase
MIFCRTATSSAAPTGAHPYLDAVMLICCKDLSKRITGFAGVAAGKSKCCSSTRHRGQGVGKLLLLRHQQLNADELDVNEQNPQALAFTSNRVSR